MGAGTGYLSVELGAEVQILHIGSGDEERGWIYARCVALPNEAGWLPMTTILPCVVGSSLCERTQQPAARRQDIRTAMRAVAPWPTIAGEISNGDKYLAPIEEGELVEVLREGIGEDEGWVFAR